MSFSCTSGVAVHPITLPFASLFDDPDRDERALYAKYWQDKLKDNKDISYPDSLVDEVASSTNKFSFAYLKEALCVYFFSHTSHAYLIYILLQRIFARTSCRFRGKR